jgi:ubiquinone/menaquinone biosynthesis C-methylase UbiE
VSDRELLRATFNQVAELYGRTRPGYPAELLTDLAELAGIGPGCRVLEIGWGTRQRTLPLAEWGCEIAALDIGAEMAALALRKLVHYPAARVIVAAFEGRRLPEQPFDAVVSATALHWLDTRARHRFRLPDGEVAALLAFLEALTSPTLGHLEAVVPAAVPSGLPVDRPSR